MVSVEVQLERVKDNLQYAKIQHRHKKLIK